MKISIPVYPYKSVFAEIKKHFTSNVLISLDTKFSFRLPNDSIVHFDLPAQGHILAHLSKAPKGRHAYVRESDKVQHADLITTLDEAKHFVKVCSGLHVVAKGIL